ncbi:MAG TPA: hypothetical protein VN461_06495 [Vicinamibacteria bacterium]|jgi:hypothetical protein|nr:hypothetical protein [Vicinamibacteria bacterium]
MASSASLLFLLTLAPGNQFFDLRATFVAPTKAGTTPSIEVTFVSKDPEVHINEEPAPRLKLDVAQSVLVDKQLPLRVRTTPYDPSAARYLDLSRPLKFPVGFAPTAPKGAQSVGATITFFYCSRREGWCRRGSLEVEVPVTVP